MEKQAESTTSGASNPSGSGTSAAALQLLRRTSAIRKPNDETKSSSLYSSLTVTADPTNPIRPVSTSPIKPAQRKSLVSLPLSLSSSSSNPSSLPTPPETTSDEDEYHSSKSKGSTATKSNTTSTQASKNIAKTGGATASLNVAPISISLYQPPEPLPYDDDELPPSSNAAAQMFVSTKSSATTSEATAMSPEPSSVQPIASSSSSTNSSKSRSNSIFGNLLRRASLTSQSKQASTPSEETKESSEPPASTSTSASRPRLSIIRRPSFKKSTTSTTESDESNTATTTVAPKARRRSSAATTSSKTSAVQNSSSLNGVSLSGMKKSMKNAGEYLQRLPHVGQAGQVYDGMVYMPLYRALSGNKFPLATYIVAGDVKTEPIIIEAGSAIPPKPNANHVRIVMISDTHGKHRAINIPPGDILLHCGDITMMNYGNLQEFNSWLLSLTSFKSKLVIGGHHDRMMEEMGADAVSRVLSGAIYLENSGVELETWGLKVWGCPYSPASKTRHTAFQYDVDRKRKELAKIPRDINILMGHWVDAPSVICHPRIYVNGYYKDTYGVRRAPSGTVHVNATICDHLYRPVNPPVVVDLDMSVDALEEARNRMSKLPQIAGASRLDFQRRRSAAVEALFQTSAISKRPSSTASGRGSITEANMRRTSIAKVERRTSLAERVQNGSSPKSARRRSSMGLKPEPLSLDGKTSASSNPRSYLYEESGEETKENI